jgi:hypothetical protein
VMICDWHYERPDKTAVYFAMKGFKVVTCPWRNPGVAVVQAENMMQFRKDATAVMKDNFQGMVQTEWSSPASFMDGFYNKKKDAKGGEQTSWNCFNALYQKLKELNAVGSR